ncbi:amino acid ABC transporter permease [Erysipelothrix urinaevulpis]|uniref:amino acid ABC transporter permease n=1 Tax=Erysipelothrix urinaevulpis TaxID=2683717 RepID=UPI00135C98E1|nr:amino acid ABC transporter permease [Erysipelothrix urinaevulpis]
MIQNIFNILEKYGHVFLKGTWGTLYLSLIVVFFGTIVGALISLMKMSKFKPFSVIASVFVEIVRGTPILLQLYLFYYLGADLISNQLPDTFWVITALIVNSSAYVSEIFRAGIQAVDKGQFEASKSLGLSNAQMMRFIILPQAIKNILPALGNEFITMIKETSLASIFFINSLMTSEAIVSSTTHMKIESLIIVGIIYFIITFTLSKLLKKFEGRLQA